MKHLRKVLVLPSILLFLLLIGGIVAASTHTSSTGVKISSLLEVTGQGTLPIGGLGFYTVEGMKIKGFKITATNLVAPWERIQATIEPNVVRVRNETLKEIVLTQPCEATILPTEFPGLVRLPVGSVAANVFTDEGKWLPGACREFILAPEKMVEIRFLPPRLNEVTSSEEPYAVDLYLKAVFVEEADTGLPQRETTIDIKINGSDSPSPVEFGAKFVVSWTSTNAISCNSYTNPGKSAAFANGAGYWGRGNMPLAGAVELNATTEYGRYMDSMYFNIRCGRERDEILLPVVRPIAPTFSLAESSPSGDLISSAKTELLRLVVTAPLDADITFQKDDGNQLIVEMYGQGYDAIPDETFTLHDEQGNILDMAEVRYYRDEPSGLTFDFAAMGFRVPAGETRSLIISGDTTELTGEKDSIHLKIYGIPENISWGIDGVGNHQHGDVVVPKDSYGNSGTLSGNWLKRAN